MTTIGTRAAETISDHVTLVRTITVEYTSDFVLHEERTVVRFGADDVLDLTTTKIAPKTAS
jgi:hypothetical protein